MLGLMLTTHLTPADPLPAEAEMEAEAEAVEEETEAIQEAVEESPPQQTPVPGSPEEFFRLGERVGALEAMVAVLSEANQSQAHVINQQQELIAQQEQQAEAAEEAAEVAQEAAEEAEEKAEEVERQNPSLWEWLFGGHNSRNPSS
jgi:hypothetical protein